MLYNLDAKDLSPLMENLVPSRYKKVLIKFEDALARKNIKVMKELKEKYKHEPWLSKALNRYNVNF